METHTLVNWPATHHPLWSTIFRLLLNEDLAGKRCVVDQLVTLLNSLGGADRRDDVLVITNNLIGEAFRGDHKYIIRYSNPCINISKGGMDFSMPASVFALGAPAGMIATLSLTLAILPLTLKLW